MIIDEKNLTDIKQRAAAYDANAASRGATNDLPQLESSRPYSPQLNHSYAAAAGSEPPASSNQEDSRAPKRPKSSA